MSSKPLKYFYDREENTLRDSSGNEIQNEEKFPFAVLGMNPTINIQIVSDSDLTAYDKYASGCSANILVDNDYSNYAPLIDLEAGDGNWTSGTGNEYYYAETDDLTEEPDYVFINSSEATEGTVGSLAQGEWGWDSANSRLYIRMGDDSDPDGQSDGYVEYKPSVTVTKPFIEVDGATINASDGWWSGSAWATADISAGELSFEINANTAQFYDRLGTDEEASRCIMQVQILETGTCALIDMFSFSFRCRNRILPSGAEMEVEITNYYTKTEADAAFRAASAATDLKVTDSSKGFVLTSPDGTEWRQTIDDDGIDTWTSI